MIDLKLLNPLIRQISEERGLPEEKIFEAVEAALAAAYKKSMGKNLKSSELKSILKLERRNFGKSKLWLINQKF